MNNAAHREKGSNRCRFFLVLLILLAVVHVQLSVEEEKVAKKNLVW